MAASMQSLFASPNVVGIFVWGASGSGALHGLFDAHPEVLIVPAAHLENFHGAEWARLALQDGAPAMARAFVEAHPSAFDGTPGPGRAAPLPVDADAFVEHVSRLLVTGAEITRRDFFIALHVAYALARGEDVSRKTTILYHLRSPEAYATIEAVLEDFPYLRAIGVTREPLGSLLSRLRENALEAHTTGHDENAGYGQVAADGDYNVAYRHQLIGWRELRARFPMPFWTLRIEDLQRDTEAQLRALVAWLAVGWDPCLTRSAFDGSDGRDALDPGAATSEAAFDALDRYVFEGLLGRARRELDYGEADRTQRLLAPVLALLPTKLERVALLTPTGEGLGRRLQRVRATLGNMMARQAFSCRHVLCEEWPSLRTRLPPPAPLRPRPSETAAVSDPPGSGAGQTHETPGAATC